MTAFMKTYMALKNALKFSIRKEIIHLLHTQNFPKKLHLSPRIYQKGKKLTILSLLIRGKFYGKYCLRSE